MPSSLTATRPGHARAAEAAAFLERGYALIRRAQEEVGRATEAQTAATLEGSYAALTRRHHPDAASRPSASSRAWTARSAPSVRPCARRRGRPGTRSRTPPCLPRRAPLARIAAKETLSSRADVGRPDPRRTCRAPGSSARIPVETSATRKDRPRALPGPQV